MISLSYQETNNNPTTYFNSWRHVRIMRLCFCALEASTIMAASFFFFFSFFCCLASNDVIRIHLSWRRWKGSNGTTLHRCNSHMFNTECERTCLETVDGRGGGVLSSLKCRIYNITTIKLWYQLYGAFQRSLEGHISVTSLAEEWILIALRE